MSTEPVRQKATNPLVAGDSSLPLIARVLAGDAEAFAEIVRLHECNIYRTCMTITENSADAEEAMQETFVKAYQHLGQFRAQSRFSTWLTRIAINESLQLLRKNKRTVSLDEMMETEEEIVPRQIQDWGPNPEQLYAAEEMRQIVESALMSLPAPYRITVLLRDVCGLSTAEAAQILDASIPAVKSRLLRGRLMVREALAARFQKSPQPKSHLRRVATMFRSLADRLCRALGI